MNRQRYPVQRYLACLLTCLYLGACDSDSRTAAKECPWALERGIVGPGIVPCWIGATQDRLYEFKAATGISTACVAADIVVECSGVTGVGAPVKFKCDGRGCELIANWLW